MIWNNLLYYFVNHNLTRIKLTPIRVAESFQALRHPNVRKACSQLASTIANEACNGREDGARNFFIFAFEIIFTSIF